MHCYALTRLLSSLASLQTRSKLTVGAPPCSGVTVIASVVVDAETDPIDTVTLSVLTAATTARTTATPTTAAGTIGAAAVVGVPASSCTTEGCPVAPTTYAQATTVG